MVVIMLSMSIARQAYVAHKGGGESAAVVQQRAASAHRRSGCGSCNGETEHGSASSAAQRCVGLDLTYAFAGDMCALSCQGRRELYEKGARSSLLPPRQVQGRSCASCHAAHEAAGALTSDQRLTTPRTAKTCRTCHA